MDSEERWPPEELVELVTVTARIGAVASITVALDFGFGAAPLTASPSWTDASAYLRGVKTTRGKKREIDQFTAGRMTLTLDNPDRRFDPLYTSGPYTSGGLTQVVPMVPVRLRVTRNAVTYPIFRGFVDEWTPSYDPHNPRDAVVTVSCTDAFKVLGMLRLPESVWEQEVLTDSPNGWFRLGEDAGTTMYDSSGNSYDGQYGNGTSFNTRSALLPAANSRNGALEFQPSQKAYAPTAMIGTGTTESLECWVQTENDTASPGASAIVTKRYSTGSFYPLTGIYEQDGKIYAPATLNASNARNLMSAGVINDNRPHHIVWTRNVNTVALYVDGVSVGTSVASVGTLAGADNDDMGNQLQLGDSTGTFTGVIDEVLWYDTELSANTVLDHYNAGANPWIGEGTGQRIGKILDIVGWPAGLEDLDTGNSTLGIADLDSKTALAYIQEVEQLERGAVYVDRSGNVRFRERHALRVDTVYTTAQATFGDLTTEVRKTAVTIEQPEELLRNKCTVTIAHGATFTAEDATSITSYGERTIPFNLPDANENDARALASWTVERMKDPVPQVTQLKIPTARNTTIFDAVLGLELEYQVRVKHDPPGTGTIDTQVWVQGIDHDITPDNWTTTLWCAPVDPTTYALAGTALAGDGSIPGY